MRVPSIKGSAFQSVLEDVKRLMDEDRIEPADLAASLSDKDRGLLDAVVTPLAWFPMATYGRMLELLAREEGGADPLGYLCARGASAAERMLSGTDESFAVAPGSWGLRVGQTMMGIAKLLYNFSAWSFRPAGARVFEIEVSEARDYPDPARYAAQGFLRCFAERAAGVPMQVKSARPTPDRIVFRIEPA